MVKLEISLHFSKTVNEKSLISGDFIIITLKIEKRNENDYDKFLWVDGFKIQNLLGNRVTSTSKTCNDHLNTTKEHKKETLKTTISDHFAETAELMLKFENCKGNAPVTKKRNSINLQGEKH